MRGDEVLIYTDGGCDPNPGPGGWGALIIIAGKRRELSGADPESTNNRMELTAAINALRSLYNTWKSGPLYRFPVCAKRDRGMDAQMAGEELARIKRSGCEPGLMERVVGGKQTSQNLLALAAGTLGKCL